MLPRILTKYHAQCTTANILTCVPVCNATTHGYELLATIDGADTKFSCNLANLLFSWVGAAALGGYLGSNFMAFFSAVKSGAAGAYFLTLAQDAAISTYLAIQPGQNVHISGSSRARPSWGSGDFTVMQLGELTTSNVVLIEVRVHTGARATIIGGTLTRLFVEDFGYAHLSGIFLEQHNGVGAHGIAILENSTLQNSGGTVYGRLELYGCQLPSSDTSSRINAVGTVEPGGQIVLSSMTLSYSALQMILNAYEDRCRDRTELAVTLSLDNVTVSTHPNWGILAGTVSCVMSMDQMVLNPPAFIPTPCCSRYCPLKTGYADHQIGSCFHCGTMCENGCVIDC